MLWFSVFGLDVQGLGIWGLVVGARVQSLVFRDSAGTLGFVRILGFESGYVF